MVVLPLVDVDRDLLPIQFEVDPGDSIVWNRDELNEAIVQRIALTHEDRLGLLNQFLDLVDIHSPAPIKNNHKIKVKHESKVFILSLLQVSIVILFEMSIFVKVLISYYQFNEFICD